MGFRRWVRNLVREKEPERKLQEPGKDQKKLVRVDPLERLASLKAADLDLTIQLHRTTGGSGAVSKQWHITEVDPLTFYDIVAEALGGGAYRMTFRKPDATLYRLDGSDSPETHTFTVAGKPKLTGEPKEKTKSAGIDWLQDFMKEGSIGPMLLKSFFEQRGKPDEVLLELLKSVISGNGNKAADPTALLANVTETVVKLKEAAAETGNVDPMQSISQFMTMMHQYNAANKPPVATTGSNSTGLDRFFESLAGAAPAFAPIIANALAKQGGEPAASSSPLPGAPDNVISMPERQMAESQTAFAGTGATETAGAPTSSPGTAPVFNPLSAFNAPDLGGEAELGPQSAAFGAVIKLRYMIGQQADPLDIASEMVDTINLIKGAKRVEGVWENYIDDPGAAFDQFAPLIPEWLEHPEYRTECREAMVKAVTEYFESDDPIIDGATEIETDHVKDETESSEEPVSVTTTDDTVERTGNDDGQNDHGLLDG